VKYRFVAVLPLLLAALLLACNGSDSPFEDTDVSPAPTGTEPIFQRSPSPGSPTATPTTTATAVSPTATPTPEEGATPPADVDVKPVEPFEVTVPSGDQPANVRAKPSTDGRVVGIIAAGRKAKVVGEAVGQEVTAGNNVWYFVEASSDSGEGFVYSGVVEKVE